MQFGSVKPSAQPAKPRQDQVDGSPDDLPEPENNSGKRSGSASPSPPLVERKPSKNSSPQASGSSSPLNGSGLDSRAASPAAFRYPFHQTMQSGLFDTHTPTAIRG